MSKGIKPILVTRQEIVILPRVELIVAESVSCGCKNEVQ
jgi:hypothetical protein